jgi:hypothetical protein
LERCVFCVNIAYITDVGFQLEESTINVMR